MNYDEIQEGKQWNEEIYFLFSFPQLGGLVITSIPSLSGDRLGA